MMKISAVVLFICWFTCLVNAQSDFDNYVPLRSKGSVPTDFSIPTAQKIDQDTRDDLGKLSRSKREFFIEQIHYSIDGILHSGSITFGDTISTYLQELGEKLLVEKPNLLGKLRFYCMNTPKANAFCTRQGIVFVTTGLIAQLTTEAQLAFVLAHEIVHYEKNHLTERFQYGMKEKFSSYSERMRLLTNYSKDHELEADKLAVEMVYKAGYAASELNKTFDVLLYSYLPFEELKIDPDYFKTDLMYVPNYMFKFRQIEISAKHKYNDYLHSHPNLEKRKNQVTDQIALFPNWKDMLYSDSTRFFYIRDVARFEYLSCLIYEKEYVEALYAVYILEKKYPNSTYLLKCKAQAWLDVMETALIYKSETRRSRIRVQGTKTTTTIKNYEGQISAFAQIFGSLPRLGRFAMGLRQIYDIYQKDPNNPTFKASMDAAIQLVATSDDFNPKLFSVKTYKQMEAEIQAKKQDSTVVLSENLDKYQAIENKSKGLGVTLSIDSTKFYLYGISDLIQDSSFLASYRKYRDQKLADEKEDEEYNRLTDFYQGLIDFERAVEELSMGMDSMIFIAPSVYETNRKQVIRVGKTLKTREIFYESVEQTARKLHMHIDFLGLKDLSAVQTEDLNARALIAKSLSRAIHDDQRDYFVFDQEDLLRIKEKTGIDKLLYVEYQHNYIPQLNFGNVALFTVLLPVGLIYFPIELLSAHNADWQFYVYDLATGKLCLNRSFFHNDSSAKHAIGSKIYAVFSHLKMSKDE